MQQLFSYYTMIRNGYFRQMPYRPNGFENFSYLHLAGPNVPQGIAADRHWKSLTDVTARWRSGLEQGYKLDMVAGLIQEGQLRPMVFSDVDFAIIGRDAQGHLDQYVADRATLEAWGTCPTVCVLSPRTPTRGEIEELYGDIESVQNPIAIINPQDRNDPLLGLNSGDVFSSFDPNGTSLGQMLADMARGQTLQPRYSAANNKGRAFN